VAKAAAFKADRNFRSWASLGSHVDHYNKILYVETPKAACTSLKWLLRGIITSKAILFNPRVAETSLPMFVHDRSQSPLPTLTDCTEAELDQLLTSDDWFRFCVVRHPVERIFSAWKDKVFLCEPGYERYRNDNNHKFIRFEDFAAHVVKSESPRDCDIHWRSQYYLLRPDIIPYTKVYDISAVNALIGDLESHLQTRERGGKIAKLQEANRGYPLRMQDFLTATLNEQLLNFYDLDMKKFGYNPHSCSDPEPDYNIISNSFTEAVFDRNRVIALHSLNR
jgi:hypothetical protein